MNGHTRIPVIVGVGQVNDRNDDPSTADDSRGLMDKALRGADRDGGGNWLEQLDSLAVVSQISCPELGEISTQLAERFRCRPRYCYSTPTASGDGPILLLNEAANRIARGDIQAAAIVGGEAIRTAARRAAARPNATDDAHHVARAAASGGAGSYRHRYALVAPVDVYPLYENAGRAASGLTLAEGQAETAAIWSQFSEVAANNPGAWLRQRFTAEDILTESPGNRRISFPYTKLMVANSSVNQGAGFIVTSLSLARARGVPTEKTIYVGRGAAAHEADDILARPTYARSASMTVSLCKALEFNQLTAHELDYVELYSCFPCVPKMARRVLDWPLTRAASVFGGLTFGGGPIGNYMSHAVVSMVQCLRQKGRYGLLFANGGFATHNHSIVIASQPLSAGAFPASFDCQPEADALQGPAPRVDPEYTGPATVETYTVLYDRQGHVRSGVVVARSPGGARVLAKVPAGDAITIQWLTNGEHEPVGAPGTAARDNEGLVVWKRV